MAAVAGINCVVEGIVTRATDDDGEIDVAEDQNEK